MCKVTDRLHIGGYAFAANRSLLHEHDITHIINMAEECENVFPAEFAYLSIPAKDVLAERLTPWFSVIATFVTEASKADGVTLVHCQHGVSRSAAGVLAALIINERLPLSPAFRLLKTTKRDVEPNPTFLKELRALEVKVHGTCSLDQLTFLDQCEAPSPLDWKESLAIILASAAAASIPYSQHTKELDCIRTTFREAGVNTTGLEALMNEFLMNGLDPFGGGGARDRRARAAIGKILAVYLPQQGIYSRSVLLGALSGVTDNEDFVGFTVDVPIARSWLEDLCRSIREDMADEAEVT